MEGKAGRRGRKGREENNEVRKIWRGKERKKIAGRSTKDRERERTEGRKG